MNFFKGNFRFTIILFFLFFGGGIMTIIDNFDYNENKTGIIYQENNNIVLSEVNKIYNHNINYNLEDSYLHYSPVKKTGMLENFNKSNNLAVPNLIDKDYLGYNIYRLYENGDGYLDYNIYNGLYTVYTVNGSPNFNILTLPANTYTITVESNNNNQTFYLLANGEIFYFNHISGGEKMTLIIDNLTSINMVQYINDEITSFTLQIEKGTTATPYQVPYIPAMRIDFNGTNQVEYINPYEEQIIKINDINNVDNIKFELLNTKYNAVFKWNIKTNENLPFLRYYNEENKLIYDFTDLDEVNLIGNTLMANTSIFGEIIDGVLNVVDMFYTGFQKIFSVNNIKTLAEAVKIKIPVPWIPVGS